MNPRSDDEPEGPASPGGYRAPETERYLKQTIEILEAAPGIPMSASVRVNRDEILDLLDEAVARLPDELRNARWLLKERDDFLKRTRREADELIAEAKAQVAQMVQRTEVVKAAEARARHINEEAEANARRMRREAEDYCDQRLASFENVLAKVQKSVVAGRQRLAAPSLEESELGGFDDDDEGPLPGGPLPDGPGSAVFDQER
jgi:F0F1-type ATP synthase membrane subunit b/b'